MASIEVGNQSSFDGSKTCVINSLEKRITCFF